MYKVLFTNTCGRTGAKNIAKMFRLPPLDLKNFKAPLFDMKIMGQPHRKSYKLNFPRNFVVIFKPPPRQNF